MQNASVFDADCQQQWMKQLRERRFTDPPQPKRRQRDPNLARRQIGIEARVNLEKNTPAPAISFGNRLDAGLPQLDQPELGRHEKPVQQNQQESDKNKKKILPHTPGTSRLLSGTKKPLFCLIDAGMSCGTSPRGAFH